MNEHCYKLSLQNNKQDKININSLSGTSFTIKIRDLKTFNTGSIIDWVGKFDVTHAYTANFIWGGGIFVTPPCFFFTTLLLKSPPQGILLFAGG